MEENYLDCVRKQFAYYRQLGDKTFNQLEESHLFWSPDPEGNSIAVIVKHLCGNMLSRWTDFLTSDGEKEWRDRDGEFEATVVSREELEGMWNMGWDCLFNALDSVNTANFGDLVYIRNQGHSVMEAFNRQLAHYAYHVGQIVLLGKIVRGDDWASLSIPKDQSEVYNAEKFSQEKRKAHFTDDLLEDKGQ